MAAAVEATLFTAMSVPSEYHPLPTADLPVPSRVQEKGAYLAHHMVYFMLNEEGIALNGYRNGGQRRMHKLLKEASFQNAVDTLENSCLYMKRRHNDEISELVRTLDISDAQLHRNFLKAVNTLMNDEVRWGRVVALFFFSSVLAERLYKEGSQAKIESVVGWLGVFLNERVVPWVSQQRGDWAAIKDAINTDAPRQRATEKGHSKGTLFALAAVGVGAFVVGTLAIR